MLLGMCGCDDWHPSDPTSQRLRDHDTALSGDRIE